MTPVTRSHVDATVAALTRERDAIDQTIRMLQTLTGVAADNSALPAASVVVEGQKLIEPRRRYKVKRIYRRRKRVDKAARPARQARTAVSAASRLPRRKKRAIADADWKPSAAAPIERPADDNDTDAAKRRAELLALITKSAVGLTAVELREKTPRMKPKDRQNALSGLKVRGDIKRAGNTWIVRRPAGDEADA